MNKTFVKVLLAIVIVALSILIIRSVNAPIKFENEINKRRAVIIERLKDIRTAENLFRTQNDRFTGSFDTLIEFIKVGQIPEVKMVPDPNDTTFTRTIIDTIGFISIYDSLYSKNYKLDELHLLEMIPYSQNEKFTLTAGSINRGGLDVSVFEALAPMETYTHDMNEQLVINRKAEIELKNKYPGLKVGSMTEASTDGNWE
ncbi:MAG: hypothetical protein ACOXZ9_02430 [Bacteroidales bacterium]|jgi:hypothetical protein